MHLGMEVAFVSEFTAGQRVFRFVDGEVASVGLTVDAGDPCEQAYCSRVVEGRIPQIIHDAQQEPGVADLPVTKALPVGAHMSVPITFSDGRVYGTFCCFSRTPDHSLTEKDLSLLRMMADLVSEEIEREELETERRLTASQRIRDVLGGDVLEMAFQPIMRLSSRAILGVEALARFHTNPPRNPAAWFEEAWTTGLGVDLEIKAARLAIARIHDLPAEMFLSVNISPETALSPQLLALMQACPAHRLVLELTEHLGVTEYRPLQSALIKLKDLGARIAIDDVGTGYSGLQHLIELHPDILKLDMSITRGIEHDPVRRSLATAVATFAAETGIALIAEGIETQAEMQELRERGIDLGQGYLLGRPQPFLPHEDPSSPLQVAGAGAKRSRLPG